MGVPRDVAEARKWIEKSAEQGFVTAETNLGDIYLYGKGVTPDYSEALKWFRKSAEQGDAVAQLSLGQMYSLGQGVTPDEAEAESWFHKAADQGNQDAKNVLAAIEQAKEKAIAQKEAQLAKQRADLENYEATDRAMVVPFPRYNLYVAFEHAAGAIEAIIAKGILPEKGC